MISNFLTHEVRRKKKPPKNDPQRNRLYKLEREYIGVSVNAVVSKSNLQDIADHVRRYYKIKQTVKVIVVDQPWEPALGWCESWSVDGGVPFDFIIYQNRGYHGASMNILLHELAHYVTDIHWQYHQVHGLEFMAVYRHLLDKYRIMPGICFDVLAKKHRISVGKQGTPSKIRS